MSLPLSNLSFKYEREDNHMDLLQYFPGNFSTLVLKHMKVVGEMDTSALNPFQCKQWLQGTKRLQSRAAVILEACSKYAEGWEMPGEPTTYPFLLRHQRTTLLQESEYLSKTSKES